MVEFALVLPILIALVCGIMDFGWLFFNYLSLQNATREGARRACVISQMDDPQGTVTEVIEQNLPEGLRKGLVVEVTYTSDSDRTQGDVIVRAKSNIYFLTPVLGTVYKEEKGGKRISAELTMKVES
ncbi:MAG: pilus assembly protein [Lachnospiraceae bacterium]|nr:pilus assembly protein [Lachnospiraceae bacterium]